MTNDALLAKHQDLLSTLLQLKLNGRLGHAYLFFGDDISLLTSFVTTWANSLICKAPNEETGESCGQCKCCIQFEANSYPYLNQLKPMSKSRMILTDEVRDFEYQLSLSKEKGYMRIGIVHEADRLHENAQNAFLKTLEEPPPNTVLILTSTHPQGLLTTIRSRCQNISLMHNRRRYDLCFECNLFECLSQLRKGARAATGLRVAATISAVLKTLKDRATELVEENAPAKPQQEDVELSKTALKELNNLREAQIQSEYLRLRTEIVDGIYNWFLQLTLITAGIPQTSLPHPEFITKTGLSWESLTSISAKEAEQAYREVNTLIKALRTNTDEQLAIEAFCLTLSSN
jgi:DNA polymerase-3 subunit delta'